MLGYPFHQEGKYSENDGDILKRQKPQKLASTSQMWDNVSKKFNSGIKALGSTE
jgi:hypothetical protein